MVYQQKKKSWFGLVTLEADTEASILFPRLAETSWSIITALCFCSTKSVFSLLKG